VVHSSAQSQMRHFNNPEYLQREGLKFTFTNGDDASEEIKFQYIGTTGDKDDPYFVGKTKTDLHLSCSQVTTMNYGELSYCTIVKQEGNPGRFTVGEQMIKFRSKFSNLIASDAVENDVATSANNNDFTQYYATLSGVLLLSGALGYFVGKIKRNKYGYDILNEDENKIELSSYDTMQE